MMKTQLSFSMSSIPPKENHNVMTALLLLVLLVAPSQALTTVLPTRDTRSIIMGNCVRSYGPARNSGTRGYICCYAEKDPAGEQEATPSTPSSSGSTSSGTDDLETAFRSLELGGGETSNQIVDISKELIACLQLAVSPFFQSDDSVRAEDIVQVCDTLDADDTTKQNDSSTFASELKTWALKTKRYELLAKLMRSDYKAYIAMASFLSPSRIPRLELPNVQDVPYDAKAEADAIAGVRMAAAGGDNNNNALVADCELENMQYNESPLDKLLLSIFRKLVTQNTNGVTSEKPGIDGLLEQGRTFLLQPNQTAEAQHKMVRDTLGGLMTPVLPPFYRIFMSGIVPNVQENKFMNGQQIGPWFYAPFLTSFVTPTFFGFLVGPSRPNRRKDGQLGGLVVEKCKFLQESGCKGLCLHQCKLPAQQFFKDELGLALTVSPNFVTQECQWSFGEEPLPASQDPSFPDGCLQGCQSRQTLVAAGSNADICNE